MREDNSGKGWRYFSLDGSRGVVEAEVEARSSDDRKDIDLTWSWWWS